MPEPDETTWGRISITIERTDGQIVDAELIRLRSWIEANGIRAGHALPMHIEELQIDGHAVVTSVEECPPIVSGDSSAVTGRFVTREVDVIAIVKILGANGQIESIEGTTTHPIWSVDKQDWIGLGELSEGETIQGASTFATVLDASIVRQPTLVYNVEIHGEHVYQVGGCGLLVHYTCPDPLDIHRSATHGKVLHDTAMREFASRIARENGMVRTLFFIADRSLGVQFYRR